LRENTYNIIICILQILLIIDGTDVTEHNFGPPLPQSEEKSTLSVALIGHVILTSSKKEKPGDETVVLPDGYDVGSVMLFTGELSLKNVPGRYTRAFTLMLLVRSRALFAVAITRVRAA